MLAEYGGRSIGARFDADHADLRLVGDSFQKNWPTITLLA